MRSVARMKTPRSIPSAPSTPPPPYLLPSKATTRTSFSSRKPRNILTNPTPPTTEDPQWKWIQLNLSRSELYLPLTFPTGQTFTWKQTGPIQYTGVVGRSHLVSLMQLDNGDVVYHFHCTTSKDAARDALLDFLNVGISLTEVWDSCKVSDSRFAELAAHLGGARVLRQDPLECLIQFICSSNNNIKRITMMVDFISSLGNHLGTVGGFKFYEFPSLERLAMVSEQELRAAGFGYRKGVAGLWEKGRAIMQALVAELASFNSSLLMFGVPIFEMSRAKYIVGTAKALQSKPGGGTEWLGALRKVDLPEAIDALCSLPGVGPKVAACVALFSLDQHHAIPVDTHVWQMATRYLLPELAGTALTPKLCNRVAEAFVRTYGKYAGWAQTLLFIAELPSQKALLPSSYSNHAEENSPKSKKRKRSGNIKIPKE